MTIEVEMDGAALTPQCVVVMHKKKKNTLFCERGFCIPSQCIFKATSNSALEDDYTREA